MHSWTARGETSLGAGGHGEGGARALASKLSVMSSSNEAARECRAPMHQRPAAAGADSSLSRGV